MTKKAIQTLATVVAMTCAANPCLAQDQMGFAGRGEQPPAAFAGVNLRLELGSRGRPTPVARLAIGRAPDTSGSASLPGQRRSVVAGFELGLNRGGAAEFHIAGQPAERIKKQLNAAGNGLSPVMIGFGVVLLGVGILVISNLNSLGDEEPANN